MTGHNETSFRRIAAITLAIGIGAATAVITVAEALLIRPLPVAAEDQLAILYGATADGKFPNVPITLDELTGFRRQSRALQQVAYHTFRGAATETFNAADRPVQLRISLVSGNWFDVLGAQPSLGRTFRQEEDTRGNNDIIFVSLSGRSPPRSSGWCLTRRPTVLRRLATTGGVRTRRRQAEPSACPIDVAAMQR
jgi:hypothetical protein